MVNIASIFYPQSRIRALPATATPKQRQNYEYINSVRKIGHRLIDGAAAVFFAYTAKKAYEQEAYGAFAFVATVSVIYAFRSYQGWRPEPENQQAH